MKQAKRAITLVVFAVTVGCTSQLVPATPPPSPAEVLPVYHTMDTNRLISLVANDAYAEKHHVAFEIQVSNHLNLMNQLENDNINYFISHHNPIDPEQTRWSAPLVQDGIAILVHPENPINDISSTQLQAIYRGFITNWSEIGGENQDITLYSREAGAGLRLEFNRLVMGQQQTSPNARVLSSSELMIAQMTSDNGGIGYIPISVLTEEIKSLAIDSVLPSTIAIQDNSYPLRSTVYVIGQEEPVNHYQQFFIAIQNIQGDELSGIYAPLPR